MVGEARRPNLGDIGGDPTVPVERPAVKEARPVLRGGLLGRGIQGSLSPRMHEAEGARLGLRYEYRLFDFDRLELEDSELRQLIGKLKIAGYAGFNVTHPFKERVVAMLDRLSEDAAAVGAVNTVVFESEAIVGHNTDCWGFAESFRRGLKTSRLDHVVLLGAGGAGRAVAKALFDLGAQRVSIFDTDSGKAARLAKALGEGRASHLADVEAGLTNADGVVNATPLGMAKYSGMPVEANWLRSEMWVADIVYFPAETELLRCARAAGCQTLPGAGMAVFQAVRAFELITGHAPDWDQMAGHFLGA